MSVLHLKPETEPPLGMPWWCPNCKEWLRPEEVTFLETHDTRTGGCGHPVE